jgi:hypothetical protein
LQDDQVPLILTGPEGKKSQGKIDIYFWSKKRARRRGIFVCSFIYFIGFLASASPAVVIHLIGPWVAMKVYRAFKDTRQFRRGVGTCPQCEAEVKFAGIKFVWPIVFDCRTCQKIISAMPTDSDLRGIAMK